MSKMSELDAMIRERLERGEDPVDIAYALEIPLSWIYEVEENSPYATSNS
jgi:hypothetical protein